MVQSARGGRAHRDGARRLAADERPPSNCSKITRLGGLHHHRAAGARRLDAQCLLRAPWHGSGFIWDDAGHVVTNFHVIQGASEATVKLADGRDYQAALVGRAQRTTSPYSRSVSASNARLPCRSAPAPTSRWDRRCLLSATPLAWTGRSPPASSPRSTARYREKRAARPLITWFRPTPPLTPATRAAPARFGRAAYRHQHGDLQPLRRLGRDRFCRAGGHRHAGSAATHQDRQIHPPGAWHRGGRTAQSAPACADGKQGRVRAACHPGSAAHKAGLAGVEVTPQGIVPGDRIIDVDGKATDDVAKLLARLDDRKVGDVVVLSVERAGKSREVRVELQPGN